MEQVGGGGIKVFEKAYNTSNTGVMGKEKPRPKEQGLSYLSLYL